MDSNNNNNNNNDNTTTTPNNNNDSTISTTSTSNSPKQVKINHLVILQHGLHGTWDDFTTIRNHFIKHKYDNCAFVSAKSNSYFLATHDGINKIGTRLYKEVLELYKQYEEPEKISFIGHSLGGLITRYAIGLLYRDGFFERCKPDQFISLSSPHCGGRRPSTSIFNKISHVFVDNFLSVTGKQLILNDSDIYDTFNNTTSTNNNNNSSTSTNNNSSNSTTTSTNNNNNNSDNSTTTATTDNNSNNSNNNIDKEVTVVEENEIITNDQDVPLPLLVKMTEGIFFAGLQSFRRRVLYSNIYNDIQVTFCTSDISGKNPYTLGKIMKFTEKYKHIIEEETILDVDPDIIQDTIISTQDDKSKYQHDDSKIDEFFTHDTHHHHLKRILRNLRKLEFTRYHMLFKNFLSHTNVVVKRESLNSEGWDIVNHLVDHFEP